jgi:hypothetical protein
MPGTSMRRRPAHGAPTPVGVRNRSPGHDPIHIRLLSTSGLQISRTQVTKEDRA